MMEKVIRTKEITQAGKFETLSKWAEKHFPDDHDGYFWTNAAGFEGWVSFFINCDDDREKITSKLAALEVQFENVAF